MKITDLPDLQAFVKSQSICVVAVSLSNGEVHATPVLFWCDAMTLKLYFSTGVHTEKMRWHREGEKTARAAVAIGLEKKIDYNLQMRGELRVFDHTKQPEVMRQFSQIASQLDDPSQPGHVMCQLTPYWARYTDRARGYAQHLLDL